MQPLLPEAGLTRFGNSYPLAHVAGTADRDK
jgi:hypothetical protein